MKKKKLSLILFVAIIGNLLLYYLVSYAKHREDNLYYEIECQPFQKHASNAQFNSCNVPWKLPSETWQSAGEDNDTYVFSAYLDLRIPGKTYVRIIGITSTYKTSTWKQPKDNCRFWYKPVTRWGSMTSIFVTAERLLVPETHERKYGVMLYSCVTPDSRVPDFVSLVRQNNSEPHNFMSVIDTRPSPSQGMRNFTVCVGPLLFQYNNTKQLVATMEASFVYGAGHFVFYNHSIGSALVPFLNSYIQDGLATVVDWQHFPVVAKQDPDGQYHGDSEDSPEIHYFGQVAAMNDCFYRSLHNSQYLVSQDLDELIVPTKPQSWYQMLEELPKDASAFIFRNVFFPLKKKSTSPYASNPAANNVHMLLNTLRQDNIFPYGDRSKFIINTHLMKTLGIHFTYETTSKNSNEHTVSPSVGLLHHYRDFQDDLRDIEDMSALTFAQEIIIGVERRLKKVF